MEFITQCGVPAGPIGQGTWYLGNRPDTFQQELSALRAGIDRGMTLLGQRGPRSHLGVKSRRLCSALPQECADCATAWLAFHLPARDHPFAF